MNRWAYIMFLCLVVFYTQAQPHYVFSEINTSTGLSENRIRSIGQLSDGRMAIVTEGRINIYNATSIRSIPVNSIPYPLKSYMGFHRLYVDRNDCLWIKNKQSLQLVNIHGGRYVYQVDDIFSAMGIRDSVMDVFMDDDKNWWIINNHGQLLYHQTNKAETSLFLEQLPSSDLLFDIAVVNNNLFLFFRSGMVTSIDIQTKEVVEMGNPVCDASYRNTLLVVQDGDMLYQVRNGNNIGIVHRLNTKSGDWETILKTSHTLNTLTIDQDKNIWITSQKGLKLMDSSLVLQKEIGTLQLVDGDFINTEISTMYCDRENGLWVGTLNRGLLYYHQDQFKFRNIGHSLFKTAIEDDLIVTGFAEMGDQLLVITEAGLFTYQHDEIFLHPFMGFPTDLTFYHVFKTQKGIWASTDEGMMLLTQKQLKRLSMPFSQVYSAIKRSDEKLLLATDQGLFRLNTALEKTELLNSDIGIVTEIAIYNDTLVAGIGRELFIYNTEQDQLYTTTSNPEISFFQINNREVNDLFVDSRGWVWVGTGKGLALWDPKTNQMFTHDLGTMDQSVIQSVSESKHGNIWISTTTGLFSVESKNADLSSNLEVRQYSVEDGVVDYEFVKKSVFKTADGCMYWGGLDGFNWLVVQSGNQKNRKLSKPYIVSLKLSGKEIRPGQEVDSQMLFDKPVSKLNKIELPYDQNFLTIEVSSINYVNFNSIRYRCRLRGVEQEWKTVPHEYGMAAITIKDIIPGQYTLEVFAEESSEVTSEILYLPIEINNPWWRRTSFWFFFAIVLTIIGLGVFNRLRRWRQDTNESIPVIDKNKLLLKKGHSLADEQFMEKVIYCINSNLSKSDYSVDQLSQDLFMDRTGLYRKLRDISGRSPTEVIRSARMSKAKVLLSEGKSVSEVASEVGFSNLSYFSKCFQKQYHTTPSQFKKSI